MAAQAAFFIDKNPRMISTAITTAILSALAEEQHGLIERLHQLAVEMEGAAVSQVCRNYGIPFAVVRTISDRADDTAHVDFPGFIHHVASKYAQLIVERFLKSL